MSRQDSVSRLSFLTFQKLCSTCSDKGKETRIIKAFDRQKINTERKNYADN